VIIDYEKAWVEMKAHLLSKNSHGQRDLLARMARIEIDCRVPEEERVYDPTPPAPSHSRPADRALREVTAHG
jgi:hypothetical protein